MDHRVNTIETGMTECTTVNDLIDTYEEVKEEQEWVLAKLADLEDHSRRNNVKFPESILPTDLPKYTKDLIHTILPDASPRDIIIDRIHRIAKPPHLAAFVQRDVLMRVHFFHISPHRMPHNN